MGNFKMTNWQLPTVIQLHGAVANCMYRVTRQLAVNFMDMSGYFHEEIKINLWLKLNMSKGAVFIHTKSKGAVFIHTESNRLSV